jgi:hypothetical protein
LAFSFKRVVVGETRRGAAVVGRAFGGGKKNDVPMAQRALSGFLELPAVPIGSYVSSPSSLFHVLDPRVKQAWLVALLLLPPNGTPQEKITVCFVLALVTAAALPLRVWRPQLKSLSGLCVILFLLMVAGADSIAPWCNRGNRSARIPACWTSHPCKAIITTCCSISAQRRSHEKVFD